MKKLIAIILAAMLLLTLSACNGNDDIDTDGGTDPDTAQTDAPETNPPETNDPEDGASEVKNIIPTVDADTLGGKIWDAFYADITANPNATAEELAVNIANAGIAPHSLGGMTLNSLVTPNDEGKLYLQGFGEYDFAGLDTQKSAIFLPMMGSTPFIGYIFELSDGIDAASFIKTLEENANLRWQICVSADQMVAGSIGNKVLFVMCLSGAEGNAQAPDSGLPSVPSIPGIPVG